jgi:hypothetical protein
MTHLHRRGTRPNYSLNEIATSVRYRTTNHNFIRLLLPLSHSIVVQSRLKYSTGWSETTMASPNQRFHVIITLNSICEYHLLIYRVVSFHKSNAHLLKVNNCRNYCFKKWIQNDRHLGVTKMMAMHVQRSLRIRNKTKIQIWIRHSFNDD